MDEINRLSEEKDYLLKKVFQIDNEIKIKTKQLMDFYNKEYISNIFKDHVKNKYFSSKNVSWENIRNETKIVYEGDGVYILVRRSIDSRYQGIEKQVIVEVDGDLLYETR